VLDAIGAGQKAHHLDRLERSGPGIDRVGPDVADCVGAQRHGMAVAVEAELGVDDFVPKPSRPEELVARVDRVVARLKRPTAAPTEQKMLRGDLEQVSLPSVLSFLELEKKTGILSLLSDRAAKILIDLGRPFKVELDGAPAERTSRQLLEEVLDWTKGQFEFSAANVACQDEVRSSLTAILLNHARISDEDAR